MNIEGTKVVKMRRLTSAELEREGWDNNAHVDCMVLSNGMIVYPSGDHEGNYPGAIFAQTPDNRTVTLHT